MGKNKKSYQENLRLPIYDREITMVEWLRQCGAVIGEDVDLIEFQCNPKDATCLEIREMTFFHCGGRVMFEPGSYNELFGSWLTLPEKMR